MGWKFDQPPARIIQTASTTFFDRHPDLFSALSGLTNSAPHISILSFGSSTGEECQSLRKYFPQAQIVGAEINANSRRKAIKSNQDDRIIFIDSVPDKISENGPFDVIFALSVLCKNPEAEYAEDLSSIYPFDAFENMINELDGYLKVGGWLVIRSANYRFSDTVVYKNYQVCTPEGLRVLIEFPKFDAGGKKLKGFLESEEIFQKLK
jgi:hypothetical protein